MKEPMHSIFTDMQRITSTVGFMPENSLCPDCGNFLTDTMEQKTYLSKRTENGIHTYLCKCAHRQIEKWKSLVDWANLPHETSDRQCTFLNWNGDVNTEAYEAAKAFAGGNGPHILTLTGEPDGGKSHLLEAIGRFTIAGGKTVRYMFAADLLNELRMAAIQDGTTAGHVMESYHQTNVVLLDDIAVENANPFAVEHLTALVDYRYRNNLRMAVATNSGPDDLEKKLGARISSRLFDTGTGAVNVAYLEKTGHREGHS